MYGVCVFSRCLFFCVVLCFYLGRSMLAQPDIRWLLHSPAQIADFSPDGRWMFTASFPRSVLWDVTAQQPVATFAGWRSVFLGSRLFAVHNDRQMDIYDFPSLRRVYQIPVGVRPYRLHASRDGRWLLVQYPLELQLWQTMPPRLMQVISGGGEALGAVALSADGRFFTHGKWPSEITVRRTEDGRVVKKLTVEEMGSVLLSPDGALLVVASQGGVRGYRVADGNVLFRFPMGEIIDEPALAISDDGNYLAIAAPLRYGLAWRLWRLSDGALLAGEDTSEYLSFYEISVRFSPDSRTLYLQMRDVVRTIETSTGTEAGSWSTPKSFRTLGFCRGGEQIVLSGEQGLSFYSVADGRLLAHYPRSLDLYSPEAVSPDGRLYAFFTDAQGLNVFSLSDGGTLVPLLTIPAAELPAPALRMQWTADGSWLYAGGYGQLFRIRVPGGDIETLSENVRSFAVSADGHYLVYSDTYTDTIIALDLQQGQVLYTWTGTDFQLLETAQQVAVVQRATSYTAVEMFDLRTGEWRGRASWGLPTTGVSWEQIVVSPDGRMIAVIWDSDRRTDFYNNRGNRIARWDAPYGGQPLAFSPDGRYIAIGDSTLAIAEGFRGDIPVYGRLYLVGWTGVLPGYLRYTLRDSVTGQVLAEGKVGFTASTGYSYARFLLPAPDTDLLLTVSGVPFLSRTVQVSRFFYPSEEVVVLYPGDIDGDNEVTLFDFGQMVAAFGSVAGEDRYSVHADLDGDGEISLWDFGLLVEHFGMMGDD
ncbi:MAG: hypothetical protein KatS3mg023_1593 [Armatimonadota bacterium]|nr:MAG: hypothetical protein KatS3mg023_1593 [Armatimonadota bacterium]